MVKIIHGADFHLDSPFRGLSPERAVQRRQEQRELLDRLVDLCREEEVQLLLLAGDLLDSASTFYETNQALSAALARTGAQVFIAPGNHDFYQARSPYALLRWPDNVHIFTGGWERVALPELGCVVYGAAFTAPRAERSLLEDFVPEEDAGLTRLMVLHGEVDAPAGQYDPITTQQLARSGMDYAALGHVHACSGLRQAGQTFWAYPGCPEGRGFDELGEKGVLLGSVDRGAARLDFVPLCKRRYEIVTVDVTGADSAAAALTAALPRLGREDICRVVLTGESQEESIDLDALAPLLEGHCWQGELRDQTTLRRDLWARQGEDSLTGLFLREMALRLERCGDAERPALERAVRFGLAALEGGEDR
jgi:DNA repair exonuclease SbcCD nuclease subunit